MNGFQGLRTSISQSKNRLVHFWGSIRRFKKKYIFVPEPYNWVCWGFQTLGTSIWPSKIPKLYFLGSVEHFLKQNSIWSPFLFWKTYAYLLNNTWYDFFYVIVVFLMSENPQIPNFKAWGSICIFVDIDAWTLKSTWYEFYLMRCACSWSTCWPLNWCHSNLLMPD